ncbi:hypothetical protein [Xanthomonas arboricola]|uniref:hypothetical protein n=1 Tax=Xanthomonas arboricola TaxID=56448 RepID=UPI0011B097AB|nr:hypothetical protein [Xanthomonas arboricola]
MSDQLLHLNRAHLDGQSKYTYFLLAATGAALGYALQKIDGSTFHWTVYFGLAAVGSWLVSFLLGCMHLTSIQSALGKNFEYLQFRKGSHPTQPLPPQLITMACEALLTGIHRANSRAHRAYQWQFRFLATGVLSFVAWRILILFGYSGPAA